VPIFLSEPAPHRPSGGWNRLSLNAHMGVGAQCALRPKSYASLLESYNTLRARWGGFDGCIQGPRWEGRRPDCDTCPIWRALLDSTEQIPFNASRVLVRIAEEHSDREGARFNAAPTTRLWVTDQPDAKDYQAAGEQCTWGRLARLRGWELGRRHHDPIGPGFWLHRTNAVPAWGSTVTTRIRQSSTRHAFRVPGGRTALLRCNRQCRHGPELLNALTHACPPRADEARTPPCSWNSADLTVAPVNGYRLTAIVGQDVTLTAAPEGRAPGAGTAVLTLYGSGWTAERIHLAGDALVNHLQS
jgi:hypothetical protein